ncbi:zinc metalloprotease [Crocinitomix catalasitica]|uniref:hypothetical protein n=1 Tax=Crocinitomix catalasitica TaxID=184607 RepID=UPI0004808864|nr:hypothetical protein [Crocinitomix catalasitica]
MFENTDNFFPDKPQLTDLNTRLNWGKNLFIILLMVLVLSAFQSVNYIFFLEVILVLLVHEFGHYFIMFFFKIKTQGLFFMSFLNKLTAGFKFSDSQWKSVWINLMGPLPGLLIGIAIFSVAVNGEEMEVLLELSLLFLAVNVVNILPLDPFDGGRIIDVMFFGNSEKKKLYLTLISSLLIILTGIYFEVWPVTIFGLLMGLKVRSTQKKMNLHARLSDEEIDFNKEYEDLSDAEYWKIRAVFLNENPKIKSIIPEGFQVWENEKLLMDQVNQLLKTNTKNDMSIMSKVIILIIISGLIYFPMHLIFSNFDLLEGYLYHE